MIFTKCFISLFVSVYPEHIGKIISFSSFSNSGLTINLLILLVTFIALFRLETILPLFFEYSGVNFIF